MDVVKRIDLISLVAASKALADHSGMTNGEASDWLTSKLCDQPGIAVFDTSGASLATPFDAEGRRTGAVLSVFNTNWWSDPKRESEILPGIGIRTDEVAMRKADVIEYLGIPAERVDAAAIRERLRSMRAEERKFRKPVLELDRFEDEISVVENMPGPVLSERESMHRQSEELRKQHEKIQRQLDEPNQNVEHAELETGDAHELGGNSRPPVSAAEIKMRFVVFQDRDKNSDWWKKKMRDARRNRLASCRVGEGQKGPGGSWWRPDLIAGWLVDREKKDREGGMKTQDARKALKKFQGYSNIADELFSSES